LKVEIQSDLSPISNFRNKSPQLEPQTRLLQSSTILMGTYKILVDGKIKYIYKGSSDSLIVYDGAPDVHGNPKAAYTLWNRSNEKKLKYINEMGKLKGIAGDTADSKRLIRAFMLRMAQDLHSRTDLTDYQTAKVSLETLEAQGHDMSVVRVVLRNVFEHEFKVGSAL
jgi:hypothetical protein